MEARGGSMEDWAVPEVVPRGRERRRRFVQLGGGGRRSGESGGLWGPAGV
ncbi:hypothetical protein LINPERPRIM_LOCUS16454 [Linum perenne]